MTYEEMLANANACLDTIKEEKTQLLAYYIVLPILLVTKLKDNNYCEEAINEIVDFITKLLHEADLEHRIYDKIDIYLYRIIYEKTIEEFETSPENELFEWILKLLESSYSKRMNYFMYYLEKYSTIIKTKSLNSSNYRIFETKPYITEERYLKLLDTIPKM